MKSFHWVCVLSLISVWSTAQIPSNMDYLIYPYETSVVELSGGARMAYFDSGESGGKTLVMIHGLGSYMRAWDIVKDSFPEHRLVLVDLPGYGKSIPGPDQYGMAIFAEYLKEFIDSLELGNVVMVGHSMGGQIAVTFALKYPELLESLVLVAPAGVERFTEEDKSWFGQLVTPQSVKNTPIDQVAVNFAVNFNGGILPESARFMYEDRLKLMELDFAFSQYCNMIPQCVSSMLTETIWNKAEGMNIPILVLWGTGDLLIPNKWLHPDMSVESMQNNTLDLWPSAQVNLIPKAGHFLHWDQPEEFVALLKGFLSI